MITLQEFIDKWNGKGADWDKSYGNQCVDLYRFYVNEVLGFAQTPPVPGAKDIWTSDTPNFEKIANTPTGIPEPGDVMIWGSKYGPYGHVAIVTKADLNTFTCFSQNDPSGALCGLKDYKTYTPVIGWLHPKTQSNTYRGYDLTNQESMKVCVDQQIKVVEGQLIDKQQYESIKGQLLEVQKQNDDMSNEMGSLRAEIKALTGVVESKTQAIDLLSKEDVVQLETLKREEARADKSSDKYFNVIVTIREQLKLSSSIEDESVAESEIYSALGSLIQTNESYETQVKELESQVKKLSVYKQPVAKLTTKQMFAVILEKLLGVSNK